MKLRFGPFRRPARFLATLALASLPLVLAAAPTAVETTVIGPFTGLQAPLHPDNLAPQRVEYLGTDLGWTYEHQGTIRIIFGDTSANVADEPIEASNGGRNDDAFGSIDLGAWNDPAAFSRDNMPVIKLGQNPGTTEVAAINPGVPLELFKTPVGGFSNGEDEFGVFFTYKPQGCRTDAECANGASCDLGLGYFGPPWTEAAGITWACVEGSGPACIAATMTDAAGQAVEPSGFCVDRASTIWADTPVGRRSALSVQLLFGRRDRANPKNYHPEFSWHTSKFMNPAFRTVQAFEPPTGAVGGVAPAYGPAMHPSRRSRVFVWGTPHFVGVKAAGRYLGQYFAFVDLPGSGKLEWKPRYFAGLDEAGLPRFSPQEQDAVPLDLDDGMPGVQPENSHDVIDQVTVAWVPQLGKWLMIYGGGLTTRPLDPPLDKCGVLQLFTDDECTQVVIGNGAFQLRSSDHPWGPWTPPQQLIAAGDPAVPEGQYGPGGMLYHPRCAGPDCAPHSGPEANRDTEYGWFYAPNIIEQWTRPAGAGVDIIWNASTWDPYRVILLRTRIAP